MSEDGAIRVDVRESNGTLIVTVNLKPSFIVGRKITITEEKIVGFLDQKGHKSAKILDRPKEGINNYSGANNLTGTWTFQINSAKPKRRYTRRKKAQKQGEA